MKPKEVMLIAGEASGDILGAELVRELRRTLTAAEADFTRDVQPLRTALEPRFFGAGGPQMKSAGVEVAVDLVQHSVTGVFEVLRNLASFRRWFAHLRQMAIDRQPDVIVGVDYGGFNLRFGHSIRHFVRGHSNLFQTWKPKIVQYVSPQVWASREGRAYRLARDYDLLLSIFPFEKDWYARRVPRLPVQFVGHPMIERLHPFVATDQRRTGSRDDRIVLLLPGSRKDEVRRHLPVMLNAVGRLRAAMPGLRSMLVTPNETLAAQARPLATTHDVTVQVGDLPTALAQADVAIVSTGTVTMECAFLGVPAVTLYKTSWGNYAIARLLVKVDSLTMPNLLARKQVFPEFLQGAATAANIAQAAADLLQNDKRRQEIRTSLEEVISSLGGPGASRRAAEAIARLLG
jgi:lipid-A-disaccharide synthase